MKKVHSKCEAKRVRFGDHREAVIERIHLGSVWIALYCLFLISPGPLLAQRPTPCDSPDWFTVKQGQMEGRKLSTLCSAQLEIAEDHRRTGEAKLLALVARAPQSDDAYEAHSTLLHFYLRTGRYRAARAELNTMLESRPRAEDLLNIQPLLEVLAAHPDFTSVRKAAVAVRTEVFDGNVFAPVTVQGSARSYMIDTGMDSLGLMTRSEAKSLGLVPQATATSLQDIGGRGSTGLNIVFVDDLVLGGTEMKNVPFIVVDDSHGAFVGIPEGHHGVLSLTALVAPGTLTFHKDGMLTLGGPPEASHSRVSILYAGESLQTQITYRHKPLTVSFDTGATQTTLNPPFSAKFPDLLNGRNAEDHTLNGISGSTHLSSVSLPKVILDFGRPVQLAPATLLLKQTTGASSYTSANFGWDLLQQARPLTIDFQRMIVSFPPSQ